MVIYEFVVCKVKVGEKVIIEFFEEVFDFSSVNVVDFMVLFK